MCKEIEVEVDRNDTSRGGHSVGGEEFFNPTDEGVDEEDDDGGWMGGEYVLGGGGPSSGPGTSSDQPLSRREIIARAAEERLKRQVEAKASEQKAKGAPKQ